MSALRRFLQLESTAGILLAAAALLAVAVANSPWSPAYERLLAVPLGFRLDATGFTKPLLLWINDGLMAIFFLLVGLEIKREIVSGELSRPAQIVLPSAAACAGFILPALIFGVLNRDNASVIQGWAIPAATDIAFALGTLSLLGNRVPLTLKLFLTTFATLDDVLAILVIGLFYTSDLSVLSLGLAAGGTALLALFNWLDIRRPVAYLLVGLVIWAFVLKSGVHATIAGLLIAATVPMQPGPGEALSPGRRIERALHPWVAYGVLPVFAFANAGLSLAGLTPGDVLAPLPLGIAAGLFVGKQIGIFGAVWLMVRFRLAQLPAGVGWLAIYGIALLGGIGFTMSLFIGSLAFEHGDFDYGNPVRLGVLGGSLVSAVCGYAVLRVALSRRP